MLTIRATITCLKSSVMLQVYTEIKCSKVNGLYKHFVDDIINRRKKIASDSLLTSLISYHPNINFTVEVNPSKFLDSNIKIVNGKVEPFV